ESPVDKNNKHFEFTSTPIAIEYVQKDKRNNFKTFGNVYAEYAVLSALRFKSNLGVDLNLRHNKAFNQNFGDDNGGGSALDQGTGRQNRPTGLNEDRGQETTITWNNTLSYSKALQRHEISALVGSEYITT